MLHRLETRSDTIAYEATFPAVSPDAVFDHWTQSGLLVRWWPAEAETEPRPGGSFHLGWPDMGWHLRGRYTAFDRGRHLAFTWKFDHEPDLPEREVRLTFTPRAEGGTTLVLTHGPYGDTPEEQADRESHLAGWQHFLARLQSSAAPASTR